MEPFVAIPGEDYPSTIMGFSSSFLWGILAGYQPIFQKDNVLSCKKWHFTLVRA
jgi:hypothetical protein